MRRAAGELGSATAAYEESLALGRRLVDAYGETPWSLRDLSVSLNKVGDVRRAAGELGSARAAYEESLALDRRLVDAYGETPQSLRDLSISLGRVGAMREETGELSFADAAYGEAMVLTRAVVEAYDEPPSHAIRELFDIIRKREDLAEQAGDRAVLAALDEERRELEKRFGVPA